jgi:hypothetical protein
MRWSIDRGRGGVHSDVARRAGRGRRTARPRRAVAVPPRDHRIAGEECLGLGVFAGCAGQGSR